MVKANVSPGIAALPAKFFTMRRLPPLRVLVKVATGMLPVAGMVPVSLLALV